MLGYIPRAQKELGAVFPSVGAPVSLPSSVDWRTKGAVNSIKD